MRAFCNAFAILRNICGIALTDALFVMDVLRAIALVLADLCAVLHFVVEGTFFHALIHVFTHRLVRVRAAFQYTYLLAC